MNNAIEIGKSYFKPEITIPPYVSVTLASGFMSFNQTATSNFNLTDYNYLMFLKYPDDEGVIYFTPSEKKREAYKITKYTSNKGFVKKTHCRVSSKQVAALLQSVYGIPKNLKVFRFYIKETEKKEKGQPVFVLTLEK